MAAAIYKEGQGYWTRTMSAVAAGLLIFMGGSWLWNQLDGVTMGTIQPVYIQAGATVVFIAVFAVVGYFLTCRHRKMVDFLIATEGEMKKVNWSTRREIAGSTWVVIGLTAVIAVIIGLLDLFYSILFRALNVLETTG